MNENLKVAIIGLSGKSIFLEVDEFHKPGETIQVKNIHLEPGGKGYNQAACLLKLGAKVSYLTTVGDDSTGVDCYTYLDQANANLYMKKIDGVKSSLATILTNQAGDNRVSVYRGASDYLTLDHLEEFALEIKTANILLLTLELPLEIINRAISIAFEAGVYVILNPAPYNKEFKLYNLCNLITPNEIEAIELFGIADLDQLNEMNLEKYFSGNLKDIIITLGSNGCLHLRKENDGIIFKKTAGIIVDTLDTTGAGDVFNGSLAYFYGRTQDLQKSIELANLTAAISTTKKYVLNALTSMDDLKQYKQI